MTSCREDIFNSFRFCTKREVGYVFSEANCCFSDTYTSSLIALYKAISPGLRQRSGIDASVHVIFHVGVFHFVNQCLVIHFGPVLISQYSIDAESFVLEIDTGIPLEFG